MTKTKATKAPDTCRVCGRIADYRCERCGIKVCARCSGYYRVPDGNGRRETLCDGCWTRHR